MKEQPISFPLTNAEFLKVISNSFCRFLRVKTSRSPEKLKPLHGAIAADLSRRAKAIISVRRDSASEKSSPFGEDMSLKEWI